MFRAHCAPKITCGTSLEGTYHIL